MILAITQAVDIGPYALHLRGLKGWQGKSSAYHENFGLGQSLGHADWESLTKLRLVSSETTRTSWFVAMCSGQLSSTVSISSSLLRGASWPGGMSRGMVGRGVCFLKCTKFDGPFGCQNAKACDDAYVNPASLLGKVRMIGY